MAFLYIKFPIALQAFGRKNLLSQEFKRLEHGRFRFTEKGTSYKIRNWKQA